MIFVFGSNLAGRHGAGAARYALKHQGAVLGEGIGHFGNSYAIPTKGHNLEILGKPAIQVFVNNFLDYARLHRHLEFKVTQIGCGLAGYHGRDIAPMFMDAPDNCLFDTAWEDYLGPHKRYWGHG